MDKFGVLVGVLGLTTMGGIGAARAGAPYDEESPPREGSGKPYDGYGGYDGYGDKGGGRDPHHRHHDPDCQIVMRDPGNAFSSLLTSDGHGYHHDLRFRVTASRGDWEVKAKFADRHAPMIVHPPWVGVPRDAIADIRERYEDTVDTFDFDGVVEMRGVTYVLMPEADCSKDEFAMTLFFVEEWFYYG